MEFPQINISKQAWWNVFKKVVKGVILPTQQYINMNEGLTQQGYNKCLKVKNDACRKNKYNLFKNIFFKNRK